MSNYTLDESDRFVVEGYSSLRPFSSFLPGIAGLMGIPLWVFYVNRGQAIASFGLESKDKPAMEFQPADKAYQTTPFTSFRTFVKIQREGSTAFVVHDQEKTALIASRAESPNLMRTARGSGEIYRTTLFAKLVCLAGVKFATLDPSGMGVEMEAGQVKTIHIHYEAQA